MVAIYKCSNLDELTPADLEIKVNAILARKYLSWQKFLVKLQHIVKCPHFFFEYHLFSTKKGLLLEEVEPYQTLPHHFYQWERM